jgi:hypothetical protein
MAQRHTVYLKQSATDVTPEQMLAAIRAVEWDLVAQACGVPMERICEADENMRIENVEPPGFRWYKLHYRPGKQRPVDIERWETPDVAAGVIEEVIENLDPDMKSCRKVRKYLRGCVDTVSGSYGSNLPGEAMAPILASQVCLWLAQQLGGIIRDPCGDWYEPADADGLDLKPL